MFLQLAATMAAMLLLWLAGSSISSWRAGASMRSDIAVLSQALDGSRTQIAALQQQLASALSQQHGQHSRCALKCANCIIAFGIQVHIYSGWLHSVHSPGVTPPALLLGSELLLRLAAA